MKDALAQPLPLDPDHDYVLCTAGDQAALFVQGQLHQGRDRTLNLTPLVRTLCDLAGVAEASRLEGRR